MSDNLGRLKSLEDRNQARDEFVKARGREMLQRIFTLFGDRGRELLSLSDIKSLVKPTSETFVGIKTVAIDLIVGSEDRYGDFSRSFLPKRRHTSERWVNIRLAHLKGIHLPLVKLYELGGVYFVRDGNHRISVAKRFGGRYIDAEVTSLGSKITLDPDNTRQEIKERIIELEKREFYSKTGLDKLRPRGKLTFSEAGRYGEILEHIRTYPSCLQEMRHEEIPVEEGMLAWYDEFFFPIITVIEEERVLRRFPGRTAADLYVWIVKHQKEMAKTYQHMSSIRSVVRNFSLKYGKNFIQKGQKLLRRLIRGVGERER
jgi:hypothetical protein